VSLYFRFSDFTVNLIPPLTRISAVIFTSMSLLPPFIYTNRACDDYSNAMLLIEGVMMTATEPADRATLQHLSQAFHGQYQHCQELLDSYAQLLPNITDMPTQPRPLHQYYQHKQQQQLNSQRGGGSGGNAQAHQMSYSQPYVHAHGSGPSNEMENVFRLGPQALYKVYPRAAINRRGSV
jgi:hypothetical protein